METNHPTADFSAATNYSAYNKNVKYANYLQNGDLSFDIYPYLTEEPSNLASGDYTMTIKAEFTVN